MNFAAVEKERPGPRPKMKIKTDLPVERDSDKDKDSPTEATRKKASDLWTKIKDKIFESDKQVLKDLQRHVQLQNTTTDFLTKLDLIDSHPELF
mmetsp:Transcript_18720/g.28713  ORF Transcript_18720/g.28713 Transcript_18720/m.28713 type:complete len:94 (-) Transcript_18720:3923-4204(-)